MLTVGDLPAKELRELLSRYGLSLEVHDRDAPIKGSFWGEPEAGIDGTTVHVRGDTPLHSLLHEACHVICMDEQRRRSLYRDAGGDDLEEAAVCYLQIVLCDSLAGITRLRLMRDMDEWGYSFRLGSTGRWFEEDAGDARHWLVRFGLLAPDGRPTFSLRR